MNWQIIVGVFFLIGGFGNIFEDFGTFLFGLVVGAALLLWGLKKKGIIKGNHAPKERTLTEEDFKAAGVNYYESSIRKLARENPDWKASASRIISEGKAHRRIYRYNYINKPVKLIPEPDNPHDENAIIVQIAGEKVGYISQGDNVHVKDILDNREIISISSFIGGGEYKVVSEDKSIEKSEYGLSVNVRIKYI